MPSDKSEATPADIAGCAVLFLAMPAFIVWRAFVLGKIWGWHLTGLFGTTPGFGSLVGLALVSALLPAGGGTSKRTTIEALMFGAVGPLIVLGVAWVVSLIQW